MNNLNKTEVLDPTIEEHLDRLLENFTFEDETLPVSGFMVPQTLERQPSAKERLEMNHTPQTRDFGDNEVASRPLEHYMLVDAIRPTFKTDDVGRLILRFDVLKAALLNNDTREARREFSTHIQAMLTTARALLVSDTGLIRKNLVRLEAAGIHVALCPSEDGDGHLLVLHACGVGFSRRVYLRKFITTV